MPSWWRSALQRLSACSIHRPCCKVSWLRRLFQCPLLPVIISTAAPKQDRASLLGRASIAGRIPRFFLTYRLAGRTLVREATPLLLVEALASLRAAAPYRRTARADRGSFTAKTLHKTAAARIQATHAPRPASSRAEALAPLETYASWMSANASAQNHARPTQNATTICSARPTSA